MLQGIAYPEICLAWRF